MSFFNTVFNLLFTVSFLALWLKTSQVTGVTYQVDFDATWSLATHPGAYPGGAHFSPLVGATHTNLVSFWQNGGLATPGIESMAETGSTSTLRNEFFAAGADTDEIILGSGIGSPGSTITTFNIEASHSSVTLVTMVAPSPDWFVGVSGLDLHSSGSWLSQLTVDLFSYDAGTDSGPNFTSPNADTNPQDPIALLGDPFTGANTSPLGTFTFTLLGDFDLDGDVDGFDFLLWQQDLSIGSLADWETNYGTPAPLSAASASVPEPTTYALALAALCLAMSRRRI
jgi:hypothetical protein